MMQRQLHPQHYSLLAVILHWVLAFALAFQMGLGWHMSGMHDTTGSGMGLFAIAQLHKSIGILILLASLARLILRFYRKPPLALEDNAWAHKLSKFTHAALYIFMIGTPLSGWLLVSSSDLNIDTYIFSIVYWPHILGIESLPDTYRSILNMVSLNVHEILSWTGIALFFMHVAGALRHQFLRDEPILWRILPIIKLLNRKYASISMFVLAASLIGLFAFAQFIVNDVKPITIDAALPTEIEKPLPEKEALPIDNSEIKSEKKGEKEKVLQTDKLEDEVTNSIKVEEIEAEIIKPFNWTITGAKALEFSVKWNDDLVKGSFSDWSADIKFASNALEQSSINVLINLSSVTTSDAVVNGAIGGVDFFNIATSSEAKYRSNSIKSIGDNRYQMDGILRLKNINKPLRIIFTLNENGNSARAKGNAIINRLTHEIGVDQNEIAKDVSLSFDFTANK